MRYRRISTAYATIAAVLVLLGFGAEQAWAQWQHDAGAGVIIIFLVTVVPALAGVALAAVVKYGWARRTVAQPDRITKGALAKLALYEAILIIVTLAVILVFMGAVLFGLPGELLGLMATASVTLVLYFLTYRPHRRLLFGEPSDTQDEHDPPWSRIHVTVMSLITPAAFAVNWAILSIATGASSSYAFRERGAWAHPKDVDPTLVLYVLLVVPFLAVTVAMAVKNVLTRRMFPASPGVTTDWLAGISVLEFLIIVMAVTTWGSQAGPIGVNHSATFLAPLPTAVALFCATFIPHLLMAPGEETGFAAVRMQRKYLTCAAVMSLVSPVLFALFWLIMAVPGF